MEEKMFNLLDEPWLRVRDPDGAVKLVSLPEALLGAHRFSGLAGEIPTQDVAVMRLLLAVLHTVFTRMDEKGAGREFSSESEAVKQWKILWEMRHYPEEPIKRYLEEYRERFWLFHPSRPFGQVPEAADGTFYTSAKLNGELSESSNKVRLFPTRTGKEKREVSMAEAARWLLYLNAFDDTSSKPKGKDLPSPGAGWLGKLGLIYAEGNNLFETLMLNTVFLKDGKELWEEEEAPEWERNEARSAERTEISRPRNLAQLYTLQSRRILLQRENEAVTGYHLLGGDFFSPVNAFVEPMTIWAPVPQKGDTLPEFRPRRHDAKKQMWREFPSLFFTSEGTRLPGIVQWISFLEDKKLLEQDRKLRFRIASVQYGDKDFFVTDVFSDSLSFHRSLLSELGVAWQVRIRAELEACNQVADAVYILERDIRRASGGSNVPATAKEQLYYRLDKPFRQWLESLNPEQKEMELEKKCLEWQETVCRIARQLGKELVEGAGSSAFAGRTYKEKEKEYYYSAPEAYRWFQYRINKIYNRKEG